MAQTKISPKQGGASREVERVYDSELLFDKSEIEGALHVQDDVITFTIAADGHLEAPLWSVYGQRITTDGVNPINFVGFNHISNISNGEVLDAGTYQFIFWHSNNITRATVMLPSEEAANLVPLSAPANFDAVMDGETEIDLTWDNVTNNSGYRIDVSLDGVSGWSELTTTAVDAVNYSHTGLSAGSQRFYRITALGDLVTFANSAYSTDQATTEDAGDITAPTFTFEPADAATDIAVNHPITITASEPLRDDDGTTVIDNSNVANYIVLKEDDGAGANISFTATIDASKTIITITPNVVYPSLGDVFVQIDGVEDVNGNESAAADATFTTSDYTEMEVNYLNFGTQADSTIVGADKEFRLKATYQNFVQVSGYKGLFQKYLSSGSTNKSFAAFTDGDDVIFAIYANTNTIRRQIVWPNALSGFTDGDIEFRYDGAIDTNDGLDRVGFYIDGVLITAGKTIFDSGGSWPFDIVGNSQPLYLSGPAFREVKDFTLTTNAGATTVIDVPVVRTGIDVSGNSFDGTWI